MADKKLNEDLLKQEDIFHQLGLENIPEEEKEKMMGLMVDTVINRVTTKIVDQLDDDQKSKFDKLVDEGDNKKITDFLRKNVSNYDAMFFNEVELLKLELRETKPAIDNEVKDLLKKEVKE
jgi:succinate dehydrogenase flavin-adding protein (antitoxin of CptAB toxin-antitoxin module)